MKRRDWLKYAAGSVVLLAAGCANGKKQAPVVEEKAAVSPEPEGVHTVEDEGVRISWIQDNAGERRMPNSLFQGADSTLVRELSPEGGVLASVSCFLVEKEGKRILFDTGLGGADSRLLVGLKSLGVSPEAVDYLFLTHFHGDHIGGMMREGQAVFPKAEVYASQMEYDAWMQMPADKNAQVVKTMEAYRERLHLFAFGDALPCGVQPMDGVGHTPGHTLYQTGRFLVVGDLMHGTALQLAHPEICASFDMDMPRAVETRKRCLAYVRAEGLTMAGMHFPPEGFIALK